MADTARFDVDAAADEIAGLRLLVDAAARIPWIVIEERKKSSPNTADIRIIVLM